MEVVSSGLARIYIPGFDRSSEHEKTHDQDSKASNHWLFSNLVLKNIYKQMITSSVIIQRTIIIVNCVSICVLLLSCAHSCCQTGRHFNLGLIPPPMICIIRNLSH